MSNKYVCQSFLYEPYEHCACVIVDKWRPLTDRMKLCMIICKGFTVTLISYCEKLRGSEGFSE